METTVFLAVLAAAAMHAGWNAFLKSSADKDLSMAAVMAGHGPWALLALALVPWPPWSSWPWMLASAGLHIGYQLFLLKAYRAGDLTQVYPIARGTAPVLVTLVSVMWLGEALTPPQLAAILLISCGLLSLIFLRSANGARNPDAARLALITSLFIAAYTLCDAYGARVSGAAIGFYAAFTLLNIAGLLVLMARLRLGIVGRIGREARPAFWIGGLGSFGAYAIAVWAFARAPVPLVAALRETSIVFALLISWLWMSEKPNATKILATGLTVAGAVLLRLAA